REPVSADGLDQKVQGRPVEGVDGVFRVGRDNGTGRTPQQGFPELEPVHAGHVDIQENNVGFLFAGFAQGLVGRRKNTLYFQKGKALHKADSGEPVHFVVVDDHAGVGRLHKQLLLRYSFYPHICPWSYNTVPTCTSNSAKTGNSWN